MAEVPRLRWPCRMAGSSLAVVEQDTDEEIGQCVETVCRFTKGDLEDLPEFGLPALELTRIDRIRPEEIAREVMRFEPRAQIDAEGRLVQAPAQLLIELATRKAANG